MAHLVAIEPLDSFFFPDHRPFNQGDPGLGEARTRFPPPPHVMAGAIRFAIARRLGWDESTALDWRTFRQAGGIDLGAELGSGPFQPGNLRFGPPLLLRDDQPLYPVPRTIVGRFDHKGELVELALLKPGDDDVKTDAGLERLPKVDAADPRAFKSLAGWWLPKGQLENLLKGRTASRNTLLTPSTLMQRCARVGLQTDYADHRNRDGMLYVAAHGAFQVGKQRLRFACRLAIEGRSALTDNHLSESMFIPFGSHGRAAELFVLVGEDQKPPRPEGTPLKYFISLLSPAWVTGGPIPDEIAALPGRLVSAVHDRPLLLGAWDCDVPEKRTYQRLYPLGSTWFFAAEKAKTSEVSNLIRRLMKPGEGIGSHTAVGFGAAVVGAW